MEIALTSPRDLGAEATAAFVVMERGSQWPSHLYPRDTGCITVSQELGESREALLRRTSDRLRGFDSPLSIAVLICNDDASNEAFEERLLLAKALLRAVLYAVNGRLVLLGGRKPSLGLRRSLLALGETMRDALPGVSACVSVLFDDLWHETASHKGGVRSLIVSFREQHD